MQQDNNYVAIWQYRLSSMSVEQDTLLLKAGNKILSTILYTHERPAVIWRSANAIGQGYVNRMWSDGS